MTTRRERHFSLRKALDLVPDDVYSSARSATRSRYEVQRLTARPTRSAPARPPCTHRPGARVPDSGSRSSCLYRAYPADERRPTSSQLRAEVCQSHRATLTEMMMCGTLPSSAMTFNRSTVSLFPTISSSSCGRYFSTLVSATLLHAEFHRRPLYPGRRLVASASQPTMTLTKASRTPPHRYA